MPRHSAGPTLRMGAKSIELLATAFKSAIGELLFCIEGAAVAAPRLRASIKPLQLRLQRLKVIAHPLPNACTQFCVFRGLASTTVGVSAQDAFHCMEGSGWAQPLSLANPVTHDAVQMTRQPAART